MATATVQHEQHFVLGGVSWETYQHLREQPESYRVRMTYSEGNLELMTLSKRHENVGRLIEALIRAFAELVGIEIQSCGATTLRREDLEKGLEPDNCYYIAHEPVVRELEEIDLAVDPPPDLAIEVEVTRRALDRLAIHAAMKVPEVWRTDGKRLTVHLLRRGRYVPVAASKVLPGFPVAEVPAWLAKARKIGETAMIRQFRQAVERSRH